MCRRCRSYGAKYAFPIFGYKHFAPLALVFGHDFLCLNFSRMDGTSPLPAHCHLE